MSFGRSFANVLTLGLWGWATDPDIKEFYKEVRGLIVFRSVEGLEESLKLLKLLDKNFKWFAKKRAEQDSQFYFNIHFDSIKEGEKLVKFLEENKDSFKKGKISLDVYFYEHRTYLHLEDKFTVTISEDSVFICKAAGCLILPAWDQRRQVKKPRCRKHNSACFKVEPEGYLSDVKWEMVKFNITGVHYYEADTYFEEGEDD